jgi:glycosyltransferase involved in cell wall biosynthesis
VKVAHLDTGRGWRGGQNQVALLVRGLARRGVASVVLAPRGPLLERAAALGATVHPWAPRGDLDAAALLHARALLARERPDVVHLHDARAHALGAPAARLARVRAVVASRRMALPPRRGAWSRLKYRLPVDRWLCVSAAARRGLLDAGVPEARAVVVPSGIDVDAFRAAAEPPADVHALAGIPRGVPLLATVGALTAEKGHALLLDVATRLTRLGVRMAMVWIGEGPERAALERARAACGLEAGVRLLGHRADVAALLAPCALLLVASRHEGFCGAAVEAQAVGLPVVACAVGGVPDVVADGVTGLLVPPADAGAMAAGVAALLQDPERRQRMAQSGPGQAARFSADLMAERTFRNYQELLAQERAG